MSKNILDGYTETGGSLNFNTQVLNFKNKVLNRIEIVSGKVDIENIKDYISFDFNGNEGIFKLSLGNKQVVIGYIDLNLNGSIPSLDFICTLNSDISDYNNYEMKDWLGLIHHSKLGFKTGGLVEYMYKELITYLRNKGYDKFKGSVASDDIYKINRNLVTLGYLKSYEIRGKYFVRYI